MDNEIQKAKEALEALIYYHENTLHYTNHERQTIRYSFDTVTMTCRNAIWQCNNIRKDAAETAK